MCVRVWRSIDLQIEPGQLVAVVGSVGSGKSSLLECLLGEMDKLSGTITMQVGPTNLCINNIYFAKWQLSQKGKSPQSWSWVTFSKPKPTQNFWTQPNPTQPTKVSTRPNPTHHRHLVWHIRLYRKRYTTTVTRHRQVHSQWQLLFSCSTH